MSAAHTDRGGFGGRSAPDLVNVLVIDNYDSFTFNLVQYVGELGATPHVRRNDEITLDEIETLAPHAVVISPGPGVPSNAGISIDAVSLCERTRTPLLGVCLGHQAIAQAFGGKITAAQEVMHGKTSEIHHEGAGVFDGLPRPFEAMRYHSLIVNRSSLPPALQVTAWTVNGEIMGLAHTEAPIEGVQFHPESILTAVGMRLLENFLCSTLTRRR